MQTQLKYYHTTDAQARKNKVSFSTGLIESSSFGADLLMNNEYFILFR